MLICMGSRISNGDETCQNRCRSNRSHNMCFSQYVLFTIDPIDPTIDPKKTRCAFPLFIPFFSTSTWSTFQTWNAGGSWWLKIITDFLRFWDLHKKLGECYQADLQLASDAWSKTSGQQILWWTGNAEVFVNPRKRCGKVKSTPKLSIN